MTEPQIHSGENDVQDFGRKLQLLRMRIGLSCDELGRRSGLNPQYIRSIERGGRDLSLSTIAALSVGLGMPLPELVNGAPIKLSHAALTAGHLFEQAPSDMQQGVLFMLRSAHRILRERQPAAYRGPAR